MFSTLWRTFCYIHQIWNCLLQTLSIWKSLKFVVWVRVNAGKLSVKWTFWMSLVRSKTLITSALCTGFLWRLVIPLETLNVYANAQRGPPYNLWRLVTSPLYNGDQTIYKYWLPFHWTQIFLLCNKAQSIFSDWLHVYCLTETSNWDMGWLFTPFWCKLVSLTVQLVMRRLTWHSLQLGRFRTYI